MKFVLLSTSLLVSLLNTVWADPTGYFITTTTSQPEDNWSTACGTGKSPLQMESDKFKEYSWSLASMRDLLESGTLNENSPTYVVSNGQKKMVGWSANNGLTDFGAPAGGHYVICAPNGQPHTYGISSSPKNVHEDWNGICEGDYGPQATFLGTGTDAWSLYSSNFDRMQILYPGLAKNTIYMLAAGIPGHTGAAKYIRYGDNGALEYIPSVTGDHLVLCAPDDALHASSEAPSASPTLPAPSAAPSSSPTAPLHAQSSGDPHFTTFGGHKFDFHGGCDLVMVKAPGFGNGIGLTIHIRTKIETWWSYIHSVVVQIGDQMIEVMGGPEGDGPNYWVNGLPGDKVDAEKDPNLATLQSELEVSFAGFKVIYTRITAKQHKFRMNLNHQGDAISIQTFKHWVGVNVKAQKAEHFVDAEGLMGSFVHGGAMMARDGVTLMEEDSNAFGKEWQVLSTEPMLFHNNTGAQHPETCEMPNENERAATKKRRLGASAISREDAEIACARVGQESYERCIFDVLATNDVDFAGAY